MVKSGGAVMVTTTGVSAKAGKTEVTHTGGLASKTEEEGKKSWIPWGTADNFPDLVLSILEKNTVGRACLHYLTKMTYGQDLFTYTRNGFDAQNRELRTWLDIQDWEDIQARTNFDIIRLGMTQDFCLFATAYADIVFDGNKSKVFSISYHKTRNVRLAPMVDGQPTFAFISSNFPDAKDSDCLKLPVIDPLLFPSQIEALKADKKQLRYLLPLRWPDARRDYYSLAYWDSSRSNGYMDISNSIPQFKKMMFLHQMSLKYHIQVPLEYWEWKYPDWDKKTADEQDAEVTLFYDEMNTNLTGAKNAQKAIITFYRTQTAGAQKAIGEFKITVLDDKMKNDAYLPDAAAANAEIAASFLVNPSEIGLGAASSAAYSGGGNNSGSNIREAGLSSKAILRGERAILNSIFKFVKLYNGYDAKARIVTMDEVLTTLDQGSGSEKIIS